MAPNIGRNARASIAAPCAPGDCGLPTRRRMRSGVALVIVLGFLVLVTVLILAFFASVSTESTATKSYANGATTKILADSATSVVMGQIAKATQGQVTGASTRLTWASQPGMIRTWDDTGVASNCYKLYSSPQMVIPPSSSVNNAMAADIPLGWDKKPAIFTDLNAPVTDSSGTLNYPILDGHLTSLTMSGTAMLTYASVSGASPDIEGFYIPKSTVPTYTGTSPSATNNPAPMPVQWLYVLKDGTIISPDPNSSGTTASFQSSAALIKSGSNPIVGRVAFWTDDETCKLNINTAAEGVYYASPHTNSPMDMNSTIGKTWGFATSPPATPRRTGASIADILSSILGEYNRYPGHPATTCLSVALGSWLGATGGTATPSAWTTVNNDNAYVYGDGAASNGNGWTNPVATEGSSGPRCLLGYFATDSVWRILCRNSRRHGYQ